MDSTVTLCWRCLLFFHGSEFLLTMASKVLHLVSYLMYETNREFKAASDSILSVCLFKFLCID